MLSKTFAKTNPLQGECYDFAGGDSSNGVPCEVNYIIQENCSDCHSEGGPGGLNLTKWSNGSFDHIDQSTDEPLNRIDSLNRIIERISTENARKQMPPGGQMDAVQRATLFKWLDKQSDSPQ